MNPMLAMLNQTNPLVNAVKSISNPQAALTNAIQRNPQLKSIIDQSGGDYQKAFYAYAQKLGVNADEILSMLR